MYFLQSVTCFSILLTGSFTEEKFLILLGSSLSAFPFIVYAFKSKIARLQRFSFFPKSLITLSFTAKIMIHFELIFV